MKRQIESTEMQKKAAENVIKQKLAGGNINKKKALLDAGYSEQVARTPKYVMQSRGYKQYLEQYNLNEERVASLISEDIAALGAGERFNYVKLLAQMNGMMEAANVNVNVTQSDEGLELIRGILTNKIQEEENGQGDTSEDTGTE